MKRTAAPMSQFGLDLMCMLPDEVGYKVLIASCSVCWSGAPTFPISMFEYAPAAAITSASRVYAVRAAARVRYRGRRLRRTAAPAAAAAAVPRVSAEILIPFGFA